MNVNHFSINTMAVIQMQHVTCCCPHDFFTSRSRLFIAVIGACLLLFVDFSAAFSDNIIPFPAENVVSSSTVFEGMFQTYDLKTKGDNNVTSCRLARTRRIQIHTGSFSSSNDRRRSGRLECVAKCASDVWCAAVYTEYNTTVHHAQLHTHVSTTTVTNTEGVSSSSGEGVSWIQHTCYLFMSVWDVSALTSGHGHYAVAKYPLRGTEPPIVAGTMSERVIGQGDDDVSYKVTAHYTCVSNGNTFKTALNLVSLTWPEIPSICQSAICGVESIGGTLVRVDRSEAPGKTRLYPVCINGERPRGYAQCDEMTGVWSGSGGNDHTRMLCLPTKCKKCNSANRCVYAGTHNVTKGGYSCQLWKLQTPRIHSYTSGVYYQEDGGDITAAGNFCRDLENDGYVWCYVTGTVLPRFERCNVPDCPPE